MALFRNAPMPIQDPVGLPEKPRHGEKPDPNKGVFATPQWIDWWAAQGAQLSDTPTRIGSAAVTGQSGSISPTDISGGGTTAGIYRLTYYLSITQAAGTSSSIAVTFNWTDQGIAKSKTFPAIVDGTTADTDSQNYTINADGSTPITYSTTYASSGAPVMTYDLLVVLEQVQA